MQLSVGTDKNFNAYQGFDIFPPQGQVGPEPSAFPKIYRLLKGTIMKDLNKMVANDLSIEEDLVRPWAMVGRQNNTIRPDVPMSLPNLTIEEACNKLQSKVPFRMWFESTSRNASGEPDWIDTQTLTNANASTKPILLFLKHFDAEKQTLTGQGHAYIGKHKRIAELGAIILERMGWEAGVTLKLYEVGMPFTHETCQY